MVSSFRLAAGPPMARRSNPTEGVGFAATSFGTERPMRDPCVARARASERSLTMMA